MFKCSKYEDAGVTHFWILDPEAPSITVLELVDGHYVERGTAVGDEQLSVAVPFAVTLIPSRLVAVRGS